MKIYCSFNIDPIVSIFVYIKDASKLQRKYTKTWVFLVISWQEATMESVSGFQVIISDFGVTKPLVGMV